MALATFAVFAGVALVVPRTANADTPAPPPYAQPVPVTTWHAGTMAGSRWMVKANDYAELPAMYGRWTWMMCGTAAAYLTSPYPITDGPCEPGQIRTFGDYFSLVAAIRAGTSGPLVVFDPEWVPAVEAANQAYYIRLGCQVAARHHVSVIVTPAGPYTATLWNELATGARYCNVVEIQSQGAETHPLAFQQKVGQFLHIVRRIHHATAMVGLATDPGGGQVALSKLLSDYRWAFAHGVRRFWMNMCAWAPPKGDGTGDPQIAVAFYSAIGAAAPVTQG